MRTAPRAVDADGTGARRSSAAAAAAVIVKMADIIAPQGLDETMRACDDGEGARDSAWASQMGMDNSSVKSNLITMLNRRERVTRRRWLARY